MRTQNHLKKFYYSFTVQQILRIRSFSNIKTDTWMRKAASLPIFFSSYDRRRTALGNCFPVFFLLHVLKHITSRIRTFPSHIPNPGSKRHRIPDPDQQQRILVSLTQKIDKLSSRNMTRIPGYKTAEIKVFLNFYARKGSESGPGELIIVSRGPKTKGYYGYRTLLTSFPDP